MPADPEDLLWDEAVALFEENKPRLLSPYQSQIPVVDAGSVSTTTTLKAFEDPLALDDWPLNEKESDSDTELEEPPPKARKLMDERMAAPQGALDPSYASHTVLNRPRITSRIVTAEEISRKRLHRATSVDNSSPGIIISMWLYPQPIWSHRAYNLIIDHVNKIINKTE